MQLNALQPNYLLSEYRIVKLLGEGGFGLTYLAFDTNLKKKVAIKEYMPSEHSIREKDSKIIAKSESSKKIYDWGLNAFINEAITLAKFEVPNIVRVYRFFKANGTAYIVMEYCEGGCLIDQISKDAFIPEAQLINIISPLVKGLQLVHDGGILHRDIKPENIMFRQDGTPVLIDFGAARQAIGAKNHKITTIVTPGYAPLEQYSSEGNIGPWSDIYSLAAVAYLCLTGNKPPDVSKRLYQDTFTKLANKTNASPFLKSIDAGLELHATNRPQSLAEWSAGWINDLSDAKQNQPNNVYASKQTVVNTDGIEEFGNSKVNIYIKVALILGLVISGIFYLLYLNEISQNQNQTIIQQPDNGEKPQEIKINNTASSVQKSIAILPFSNTKPDKETDYLSFALANQIIGNLDYLEKMTIRPASTIRKYTNEFFDPIKIGKDLNVVYILTGNYIKENNIIRLNVELININNNEIIWQEPIQVDYSDTFALQDIVTHKVAQGLKASFNAHGISRKDINIPKKSLAYEYYLRGVAYPNTKQGNQLAIAMINNAIELEPDYVLSHAELGRRFRFIAGYDHIDMNGYRKAEQQLLKALALDNNSIKTLRALVYLYTDMDEPIKAFKMGQRLIAINPNNSNSYKPLARLYFYTGMNKLAVESAEKAYKLDPKNYNNNNLSHIHN